MKILTGEQIKKADWFTIENEPISSIALMERASESISKWIIKNIDIRHTLLFLIGKGNNGGDGLAIARILSNIGYKCSVYKLFNKTELSTDCKHNLERLPNEVLIKNKLDVEEDTIIIDALLGTGVKGIAKPPLSDLINKINNLPNRVISIDLPSGMISEFNAVNQKIIKAETTLTLEFPKLAMLLPEVGDYSGNIEVLPIGLSKNFINSSVSQFYYIDSAYINKIILPRKKFAHKGTYGHALLICGSKGMIGASILSTNAALRSGCGLVTLHLPESERFSIQTSCPSAIISTDNCSCFSSLPNNIEKYTTIGIGCGLGQSEQTIKSFTELLSKVRNPLVLDADALNILAKNKELFKFIPKNSILTPHVGELKRLIGEWKNESHKIKLICEFASGLKSFIIVKGAHSMICTPEGICYFNSTGNSGMAKGGSGDVLTGYITGLLARGYSSLHASILGVYIHGLAGDLAAHNYGKEAMNSKDIINFLSKAMQSTYFE